MNKKQELAHQIIDLVEEAIRNAHPEIEKIASEGEYCEGCQKWLDTHDKRVAHSLEYKHKDEIQKPNTLLYGEDYYNLENSVVEALSATYVKVASDPLPTIPDSLMNVILDQFKIRLRVKGVQWNDEDIIKLRDNIKRRVEYMMREEGVTFSKTALKKWEGRARKK
jgi:hypothetical protein